MKLFTEGVSSLSFRNVFELEFFRLSSEHTSFRSGVLW